jgi:hypothetical protein
LEGVTESLQVALRGKEVERRVGREEAGEDLEEEEHGRSLR